MELTEEQEEILRLLIESGVEREQIMLAMASVEDPTRADKVMDKLLDWDDSGHQITKAKLMEILATT